MQQVSQSFQRIIDQLVQQHLAEITEIAHIHFPQESVSSPQSPRTPDAVDKVASLNHLELTDAPASNRTSFQMRGALSGSMHSLQSENGFSSSGGNSATASASLAKKFRHHALEARRTRHPVEARQILEAMDYKEESAEAFFENDSADGEDELPQTKMKKKTMKFGSDFARLPCYDRLYIWLQSHRFDMLITTLLCLNVLWMGLELQYSGSWTGVQLGIFQGTMVPEDWRPTVDTIFLVGDAIFTGLFTIDVVVRIVVLKLKFWKYCMNYIDVIVTLATLLQLVISTWTSVNPVLFRILRIGKLARALRVVTMSNTLASLELLTKCLQSSVDMLFWSFCLLTGIQCVAGMVVSALSREFIEDESQDPSVREAVFRYYGTFTRTFLSMFEILFANWGPPCRIVVENISEWFSVFFLLYRCVLGFAVLNVVNAVFVQQTMKTATSDEELAFKQKEREMAMYTRKVRKLFNSMDETGDGCLNLEEFQKLAQSPKLKFWMSQLELEYHDLLSLFEFLDNGDGEITPAEFIEGASRLRGSAKAVDIWRLETKVEVLMGEVLKTLSANEGEDPGVSHVQTVFNRSHYQHIHSIAKESKGPGPVTTPSVKPPASPSEDHAEPQEETF